MFRERMGIFMSKVKKLHCGECTFLKESQDGLGGLCAHPEKDPADLLDAGSIDRFIKGKTPSRYRMYEDACRHEFTDIWGARGSARLIWNETHNDVEKAFSPKLLGQVVGMVKQIMPLPSADPLLQYRNGGI